MKINHGDSILNDTSEFEIERDSSAMLNTLPALPVKDGYGSVVIHMDSALTEIDAKAFSETHTLKGYRIQIYFGDLETARAVRAKCRNRWKGSHVYLESIAPNYSVVVGDFRNRWEAESALPRLKKLYPSALIIPTDIELPKL
ncbi:MAG: SPOR domain-containing protein [Flavobacteriales bacterium]